MDSILKTADFSHYFDWAATTPPDTQILEKALQLTTENYGNPSSLHKLGTNAKELLEQARERCAKVLDVSPSTIIFTSGGTESDHFPLLSLLQKPKNRNSDNNGTIVISAIEHPAIREQAKMMENCGYRVTLVPPEKNGIVSAEKLISKTDDNTQLVCLMAVNNETGAIQPVYEAAELLQKKYTGHKKPKFHVDAVQAVGKIPLRLKHPGIDSAAISAHKIRGPRGIGILYLAKRIEPFVRGGEQENGLRPGTENVYGAIAMSLCLEKYIISETKPESIKKLEIQHKLCSLFISSLLKNGGCKIIPESRDKDDFEHFSPWIIQAAFDNIPGKVMVRALAEKGFSISTGSACSAKKLSRPVLEAMQVSKNDATNAVRFSFGPDTSETTLFDLTTAINEITADFKQA